MVAGLILLMVGAFWAIGPINLIWQGFRPPPVGLVSATCFGITTSPQVAGALYLAPALLIICYGVYLLRTLPKDRF